MDADIRAFSATFQKTLAPYLKSGEELEFMMLFVLSGFIDIMFFFMLVPTNIFVMYDIQEVGQ